MSVMSIPGNTKITSPGQILTRRRSKSTNQEIRSPRDLCQKIICITFIQCWTNVKDVGFTLFKCFTNVFLLGSYVFPLITYVLGLRQFFFFFFQCGDRLGRLNIASSRSHILILTSEVCPNTERGYSVLDSRHIKTIVGWDI